MRTLCVLDAYLGPIGEEEARGNDVVADMLFAPIWFRLIVTHDPISAGTSTP